MGCSESPVLFSKNLNRNLRRIKATRGTEKTMQKQWEMKTSGTETKWEESHDLTFFPINCGLYVQGESRRKSMIKWKFFHLRKSRCPFNQNMLRFSLVYGCFCWCTHWHLLFVEWITPWLLKAVESLGTILWSLFWGTDTTSWHLLLMCYTTEFVVDIDLCVAAMEILWHDLTSYLFDQ